MTAMHLITPTGRVYRGFEAAVRAVATRPILGWLAYAYYLPGLRQLCDGLYRWIGHAATGSWAKRSLPAAA